MDPVTAVAEWVADFVVHHQLCPFAAQPLAAGRVRFVASRAEEPAELLAELLGEVELLQQDAGVETTLLVVPQLLGDFGDFLDWTGAAEDLLEQHAADFQLAGFHPDYRFADAPEHDPAHATNRAPHPCWHLLRADSVAAAVRAHPDPQGIPERNIAMLRALASGGERP